MLNHQNHNECRHCGLQKGTVEDTGVRCANGHEHYWGVPREESPTDPSYPDLDILIAQNLADIADVVNEGTPTDIRDLVKAQTKIAYEAGQKNPAYMDVSSWKNYGGKMGFSDFFFKQKVENLCNFIEQTDIKKCLNTNTKIIKLIKDNIK